MSATKTRRQPPTVSAAVQKLLAQVQAEAQQALLHELSAKDGVLVLKPLRFTVRELSHFSDFEQWDGIEGGNVTIVRRRQFPAQWGPHMRSDWHPSYYLIDITQVDGQGREWNNRLGPHVVDDFGTLVSVKGSAA